MDRFETVLINRVGLDCRECGACCWKPVDDAYGVATVLAMDKALMGARRVKLHVLNEETRAEWKLQRSGPLKGREALVCSALRGSLMSRCSCAIYTVRPLVCSSFAPGSRRCMEAREEVLELIEENP